MFCWLTFRLMMEFCYLLYYPLKIIPLRDQYHIFWHFWIFGPHFCIFPTLKKLTWANAMLNNFWTYDLFLSPLLSSQNNLLRRSKSHFVTFLDFWTSFLDFSHMDWRSWHGQMLCWITPGLLMESCYLLFYPLKIIPLGGQNRILWHFWTFGPYFYIFPTSTEKNALWLIFCWTTCVPMMEFCYLLSYYLQITTLKGQNHILWYFWIFVSYFWIFPTMIENLELG